MPKIKDFDEWHQEATAKVSDIIRTLALSEIAVIWIFHKTITETASGNEIITLPKGFLIPLFLVILGLLFDLLQYFYKSILFHKMYRKYEGKKDRKEDIYFNPFWNKITYFFFYSKTLIVIASYILLAIKLFQIIKLK